LRWARLQYDKGDHAKALAALAKALNSVSDEKFAFVYDTYAKMRSHDALKNKTVLKFAKLGKAPKLDGNLDDWKDVAEQKFDAWSNVYLAVEAVPGAPAKKAAWKGPSDLSVSFRGGYDDKNLYVLLIVTDDQQKNEQAEGQLIDLGDSMIVLIDANNDGGKAFRGEEFSLGAGLLKSGAPVGWRWVEHGKFLSGKTPLESVFVSRSEAAKTTTYQFALPLELVSLKAEPGKQFGFSFTAYDQDESDQGVQKAVCPSPGAMQSPEPELWAKGEFAK